MAKLTKAQAMALLEKKIAPFADKGVKAIETWEPKVKATTKRLVDALKANESPELVQTQANVLRLYMGKLSEGTLKIDQAIQVIMKMQEDPELLELLADDLSKEMKEPTQLLEDARKTLEEAKKQLDKADQASAAHASDSRQARQEWAEAVAEVNQLVAGAAKELKAWVEWEARANDAVAKRDKKALSSLQKSKPSAEVLDKVAARSHTRPFEAFDKEFKKDTLVEDLRKEIERDRTEAIVPWFKARTATAKRTEIEARVAALKIEPRDAAKAVTALGLPSATKAKVQAILDGVEASIGKSLEALCKASKVPLGASDIMGRLKKAGVL